LVETENHVAYKALSEPNAPPRRLNAASDFAAEPATPQLRKCLRSRTRDASTSRAPTESTADATLRDELTTVARAMVGATQGDEIFGVVAAAASRVRT
jgi:hypothetical protein